MTEYQQFLRTKRIVAHPDGPVIDPNHIHPKLFPFQRDLTIWALRKGRAAIFADTGLGKTFMQVEWARLLGVPSLIVAPLSVAHQTVREAEKIGVLVQYARHQREVIAPIAITNYEMIEHFDAHAFQAVVLDESSILKAFDGKTRRRLIETFRSVPYRLCCTATPAPNDIAEIGNHAEFLGVMTRGQMLATFFVHDASVSAHAGWRLKTHAAEAFFRWLASWGMSLRAPSDLGYSDEGFALPPLSIDPVWVAHTQAPDEGLLWGSGGGIRGRIAVRRAGLEDCVTEAAEYLQGTDQFIAWCGLNDEGRRLHQQISGSVLVEGTQSPDEKQAAIEAFQRGDVRVLITKPRIAGFGMNFQQAHRMVFVGISDSWEQYYQCIRRCWRFGQQYPVDVKIILTDLQQPVFENVMRKEQEATRMREHLIANVQRFEQEELHVDTSVIPHDVDVYEEDGVRLLLGDSTERLREVESESVDLSIFSPPFLSLFSYTGTERDLGNSQSTEEFFEHFAYIIRDLLRVTKPGRNCCVHVSQVPARITYDGYMGIKDFRGDVIRAFESGGWIYHGEVCIDKDPQVQAVRSHAKQLLFVQLYKDSSWSVPAYADYILIFRKPGENAVAVKTDLSREQWIEWARPVWYGIKQTETLNTGEGKSEPDERHVAALQLGVIERCLRLWSNPGELILSPFAGIGSEGYMALKHKRRFVGIELKRSYFETAIRNLQRARYSDQVDLFAEASAK